MQTEGVLEIKFHNPKQQNVFRLKTFKIFADLFKDANTNDRIKCILIYGSPKIFSSGNNLSAFEMGYDEEKKKKLSEVGTQAFLRVFLEAMLKCEKPIIAIVRGAAVGIGATMLSLCDFVYCTPESFFSTPFMSTYQCPEGSSSYNFPILMGRRKANEMILTEKIVGAEEAVKLGFVNAVIGDFPKTDFFDVMTVPCIPKLLSNNVHTMANAKRLLIEGMDKERVMKAIADEAKALYQVWIDPDFPEKLMLYLLTLKEQSKLKQQKKMNRERAKL